MGKISRAKFEQVFSILTPKARTYSSSDATWITWDFYIIGPASRIRIVTPFEEGPLKPLAGTYYIREGAELVEKLMRGGKT